MSNHKLKMHLISLALLAEKKLTTRKRLPAYHAAAEQDINLQGRANPPAPIPRQVWMYWESEKLPAEVQIFVDKIARENPGYALTVINNLNLHDYLPDLKFVHAGMRASHKSDVIRLELLHRYGGIWMDATIILNRSLDELLAVNADERYDLVAFYREESTRDRAYPVMESWFLAAPKNNAFIGRWLHCFRPIVELGSEAFFQQLLALPNYDTILQGIKTPDYLVVYIAQQQALREENHYNFYLRKAEAGALLYQTLSGWRPVKLSRMLMVDALPEVLPPVYKLTSFDRKYIATHLKYGVVNSDSLLGQVLLHDQPKNLTPAVTPLRRARH
ncbi:MULTISPECIES: glycosyltransferase family 32 protein [Enterobacterales]|jgi:Mannosyltransferase OCH1 and related enzymes|uniref:Mannosyltransferase n=1 Tax=Candidatus Pantoea communis TaxID=2608354 RepID=A0ABX0RVE8_9GAMM|nr:MULTISPECIES: capsular polysaccharide synthesis protein [Enterobacterales]KGT93976.1 mannosyltransferase [Enterobacter cancerogenus]NIG20927.1 mannosyltransferase [Pantoea communis]